MTPGKTRSDATPTPAPAQKYKRSWRNLLINKRYQLRFTLFMVGLSTVLMVGLGIWVMWVANEATKISTNSVRGTPCPDIPTIPKPEEELPPPVPMKLPEPGEPDVAPTDPVEDKAPEAPESDPPPAGEPGEEPRRRTNIKLDESSMTVMAPVVTVPPDLGEKIVKRWTCMLSLSAELDGYERGRVRILWVLIATGLMLVLGLAGYGIKMTHKVAGPLFKVGLYLNKMKNGRFDKVYNLRKGDQLVDFYEHFKHGHAGVAQMERDDVTRVKAVIAAAEQAGLGEHATIIELREMVTRKEKALE